MIARASRQAFKTFIGHTCESLEAMWKKTKWSRDETPKQPSIPPFTRGDELVDDAEDKVNILMYTFFPPPVQTELSDLQNTEYPTPYKLGDITINEIFKSIK